MVVIDAATRLVPGVIDAASVAEESHRERLVEYPHYTRPQRFRGLDVPEVLLSGHHAEIARWRREQAVRRTARFRPDLLRGGEPASGDRDDRRAGGNRGRQLAAWAALSAQLPPNTQTAQIPLDDVP